MTLEFVVLMRNFNVIEASRLFRNLMNMKQGSLILGVSLCVLALPSARAEVKVVFNHNAEPTPEFKFKDVPSPLKNDIAATAKFVIVDGSADQNGGGPEALNDGRLPEESDQPARNFFFNQGDDGGRLQLDLGRAVEIKEVNSYSWHVADRAPQVYKLYAADGSAADFNPSPKRGTDPEKCGWKFVGAVDTRPHDGEPGGQYGVSISDTEGKLGTYRYLLFDISQTENRDAFGNTFFSEIDVRSTQPAEPERAVAASTEPPFVFHSSDQYCEISIDTSKAPELKEWARNTLAPVLAEWYPKLTAMLASDGFDAPTNFSVRLAPGNGVAATGRNRITANSNWLKRELNREAVGALLHEEVHVVQQYRGNRRTNPDYKRPPGWLVEGIPDYIRWFMYEPQSHGADVTYFRTRRNVELNYDKLYRISANFLNYVFEHYGQGKDLLKEVNAACRQGKYTDDFWKENTGKSLQDLNQEWKDAVHKEIGQ